MNVLFSGGLNEKFVFGNSSLNSFNLLNGGSGGWVLLKEYLLISKSLGEFEDFLGLSINQYLKLSNLSLNSSEFGGDLSNLGGHIGDFSVIVFNDLFGLGDSGLG